MLKKTKIKTKTTECIRIQDVITLMAVGATEVKHLLELAEEKFGKESKQYEYVSGMQKGIEDFREAFHKMRAIKTMKVDLK